MSKPPQHTPEILDFTQGFDGTQPELTYAEKLEAASLFKGGVQDVFLKYIESVSRLNGKVTFYPYDYSQLSLRATLDDGTRLNFEVKSFDTETDAPFSLDVSENRAFDRPYRHSRYSLDPNSDEVRRFDIKYEPLSAATSKALGKLISSSTFVQRGVVVNEDGTRRIDPEEVEATKEKLLFTWNDEFKRREVERQLGVNDQPVGPEEVKTLLTLLEQAESVF